MQGLYFGPHKISLSGISSLELVIYVSAQCLYIYIISKPHNIGLEFWVLASSSESYPHIDHPVQDSTVYIYLVKILRKKQLLVSLPINGSYLASTLFILSFFLVMGCIVYTSVTMHFICTCMPEACLFTNKLQKMVGLPICF